MTIYYSPAKRPADEDARQRAVDDSGFLTAGGDPALADIVRRAADLFGTSMAAISIVDHNRQYFPVEVGIGVSETPRAVSFCAHGLGDCAQPLSVPDATGDPRFAGNPLVLAGPEIRYYFGMPLVAADGQALGMLCVLDPKGREVPPSPDQVEALSSLAGEALRRAAELKDQ
jgi:GAF domain-containing protein